MPQPGADRAIRNRRGACYFTPTRYALIGAYFYEYILFKAVCIFTVVGRIEKRPLGFDKLGCNLGIFITATPFEWWQEDL